MPEIDPIGTPTVMGVRSDIPGVERRAVAPWELGLLQELERHLEPRDRLRAFGEMIPRILGVRLFSVFVLGRDESRFVLLLHNHRGMPAELSVARAAGTLMTDVVMGARPARFDTFEQSKYWYNCEWKGKYRTSCALSLPLTAGGATVGVLNLNDPRDGYSEGWIERAERMARHLSGLLDLARRLNAIEEWQTTDPVTGLLARGVFEEALRSEMARGRRLGLPVSCVLVDVARVAELNTNFGQGLGDAVLKHTAYLVREQCRRADLAARYEGARFALLLPGAHRASAVEIAERVRRKVLLDPGVPGGRKAQRINVTVTLGVAECPADADSAKALLRRAEEALAADKQAMGGR